MGKRQDILIGVGALGMRLPAEVYVKSDRTYSDTVPSWEYSGRHHVIKVNNWGYVRFAHFQVFLSETFANQFLEFRSNPLGDSPTWEACFRNFRIARFDASSGRLLDRAVRRLQPDPDL